MCLIVDANVAAQVLLGPADADLQPVREALFGKKPHAVMVHGGHLTEEYLRIGELRRRLIEMDRSGRARVLPPVEVARETARLVESGVCLSNDQHVLAVAVVGLVRLLCSRDSALGRDFKNSAIINKPRGKVYKTARNKALLLRHCPQSRARSKASKR